MKTKLSDYRYYWEESSSRLGTLKLLEGTNFLIGMCEAKIDPIDVFTTTFLVNQNNEMYVLEGNWRHEYEEAYDEGWEACYRVFLDNIEFKSDFSD